MAKNAVHVTRSGENWKVKSVGAKRAASITSTQAEAIQIGRRIAANRGSELVVHRPDGKIRSNDNLGAEAYPPQTRER